jgi:hypothetical protein
MWQATSYRTQDNIVKFTGMVRYCTVARYPPQMSNFQNSLLLLVSTYFVGNIFLKVGKEHIQMQFFFYSTGLNLLKDTKHGYGTRMTQAWTSCPIVPVTLLGGCHIVTKEF